MLNSVNINFVAFNKYLFPGKMDGVFFTIFIITIAAAEAAVAIAIISLLVYRNHKRKQESKRLRLFSYLCCLDLLACLPLKV
jgi:NADH:ubiquinone oxidoreductase subunit K